MSKSKFNHIKSITHKTFNKSIKRGYFIPYPIFDQTDEIKKRYISIYIGK